MAGSSPGPEGSKEPVIAVSPVNSAEECHIDIVEVTGSNPVRETMPGL